LPQWLEQWVLQETERPPRLKVAAFLQQAGDLPLEQAEAGLLH
jgi:hypothetical protein